MPSPAIDRRDLDFLLYDVLDAEALLARPRFAEHSRDSIDAVLATAARVAAERFQPHHAEADRAEPRLVGGQVVLPAATAEAIAAFHQAGFATAHLDPKWGGLRLPWLVAQAAMAMFYGANIATAAYPLLTMAAANLLLKHGRQEQVGLYLKPMLQGRFFGTMALSEPQAGSSLADIRCRAEPTHEGHYRLTGSKMWISGGAHDMAENIVHLLLARIAGAPAGVKGISLFIVPARHVLADGSLGAANGVRLAGLNHKMGYRGTVNTVLSLGEAETCAGHLVGEPNQGLAYMFQMMNEARIGVGLGAAALGLAGYRQSLDYARSRPQGRPLQAKNPATAQVPIIEHADVRRMLLAQKAYAEGGLALCLFAARLVDELATAPDSEARAELGLLLDLLTPVVKAWPSEWCLEANKWAIQVLGGYGYTRDFPLEQIYRDNRLNMIHEGTNGIQGLDLLGRKLGSGGGRGYASLRRRIAQTVALATNDSELAGFASDLARADQRLAATSAVLLAAQAERLDLALANSHFYLKAFGTLVVAWLWLKQALAASRLAPDEAAFARGKRQACQFFFAGSCRGFSRMPIA